MSARVGTSVMKGARGVAGMVTILGALGLVASFAGGCTVGSGSGAASGPIYFLGCSPNGADYGEPDALKFFDLQPHFFAGVPTEGIGDVAAHQPTNLLTIRVQRNGNRIEINDTIYFDVQNSFEVARCVRGRTVNGVPDWDPRTTTSPFTEKSTGMPWCDWSGTTAVGDGGASDGGAAPAEPPHAVIHLGTEEIVRSSLSLLFTCHQADVVGVAFDGTIEFLDFGTAAQPEIVDPELRDPVPKNFKINFGDRLRARFHVVISDERIIGAIKMIMPIPSPLIGGTIDGFFDFDLERGRAAQPFP